MHSLPATKYHARIQVDLADADMLPTVLIDEGSLRVVLDQTPSFIFSLSLSEQASKYLLSCIMLMPRGTANMSGLSDIHAFGYMRMKVAEHEQTRMLV